MSQLSPRTFERITRLAAEARPLALDDPSLDAMIGRALEASEASVTSRPARLADEGGREGVPSTAPRHGTARRPSPRPIAARRPAILGALAGAALAAAALLGYLAGPPAVEAPGRDAATAPELGGAPSWLALPSGDRLAVAQGTRYELASIGPRRRVSVARGALLADVSPLGEGEAFAVRTPHGRVEVRGTVFTVDVREGRTVVRVHEGRVRVTTGGRTRVLIRGQRVRMDGERFDAGEAPSPGERALREPARAAVARRAAPVEVRVDEAPGGEPVARVVEPDPARSAQPAPVEAPPPSRPPRPAYARRWIEAGEPGRALEAAELALERGYHGATWQMVRGDALLALDRPAEAVAAYERAAAGFGSALSARAGYAAALIRFRRLGDPRGALSTLARFRCVEGDSPVAGRAVGLRREIRHVLGRSTSGGAARSLGAP
ncbi:MAG TPA: FecR family protein [Sandaracinaceae bacterium LLY-WYZ-13_1]|nr:FecR family protein [Sandaracinaceae bacterium LLY-WYZ-13_1]